MGFGILLFIVFPLMVIGFVGYDLVNIIHQLCHKESPLRQEMAENERLRKEAHAQMYWWKHKQKEQLPQEEYIEQKEEETVSEYDPFAEDEEERKYLRSVAQDLNEKIVIENAFWDNWGLEFKGRFVTYSDELNLAYELKDINGKIHTIGYMDLRFKVNFYDAQDNLLYVEEEDVNFGLLKHHTVTGMVWFNEDDVAMADRVVIYGYKDMY